ncbi:VWA domain-containing protein [Alteromonas sp. BL110]|uniref:vWA domain-containing protein n=1 Tax=Alteromonas sp. BL110 TaxID=1714845 RepID=UPI000E505B65|nr:VWA domain-containing protein [Alteromonas sp. BL110]AXT37509.1 VWA domain-containing protein [Alteromonas sp. BL110]RKM80248.1 VWA domain-containing protein [Alteromonas sp. BL110]
MDFDFLNQFHFLRPEWFMALVPLMLLVVLIRRTTAKQSGWQSVIPSHLYQYMVIGKTEMGAKPPMWMLAFVWVVSVIALAGPTWERLPQPVYQLKMGHVIVIDMSLSMRATDMTPDRLTRAKYKAIDLVNAIGEGEMGLVAYAGDAFVISPLTEDAGNITTLIPSLSPEIMPVPGSDPLLGIESAAELLTNAGYNTGMIYWITDGIELEQQQELQEYVASVPFTVNALTVGTSEGAPIRQQSGELLKDFTGSIVIPKLNESAVKGVVKTSGGRFESFTSNDNDIDALAAVSLLDKGNSEEDEEESNLQGDQWKEVGPYLLLLLLPFAAFAFKRGLVFIVLVGLLSPSIVKNAHAAQSIGTSSGAPSIPSAKMLEGSTPATANKPEPLAWWQKPFMNDNQEALNKYQRGKYKDAVSQFNSEAWKASSLFKSGDYEGALNAYKNIPGAESLYNQGNALAKLGKLEEAIEKYELALDEAPEFEDAKINKKVVEDLLKQQQQQDQQQNQSENSNDDQQDNAQDNAQDSANNDQQQSGDQNKQEGSNDQNGQQNESERQQSDQNQRGSNDEQQNDGDNSQQPEMSEQNEPSDSQQQNAESGQRNNMQQNNAQAQEDEKEPQREAQAMQGQEAQLTDAQKEELQRMEGLMRRVPDDPAFLLKRKMQLEAQKRQRQRMPSNRSDW